MLIKRHDLTEVTVARAGTYKSVHNANHQPALEYWIFLFKSTPGVTRDRVYYFDTST
jgi:hypothetical protein